MRFKEISETPYLDKITKQVAPTQKTGAPIPANKLPKGPIKSPVKGTIKQTNTQANQQLMKRGAKMPIPTAPGKETDYEVDQVKGDEVTLKTKQPSQQAPQSIKVSKKDLNPVITNLQRRQKATT